MHTSRVSSGLLFALLLVMVVGLPACSSSAWLNVRNVPEDGYTRTLNYQFQARVHSDEDGNCKQMMVRVKSLNKMYSRGEPPSRLQLFDDDCMSPFRFERVQYITREGEPVRLFGTDVARFLSDYTRLESELVGWLWREGVI